MNTVHGNEVWCVLNRRVVRLYSAPSGRKSFLGNITCGTVDDEIDSSGSL
jgi:hypothetical protein